MVDNVQVTPGVGADVATDDVAGVHFQKIKVDVGSDGVSVPLVGGSQLASASFPVALASDQIGAGLSQEDTNQGILLLLSAILDRLPRVDQNDRAIVSLAENTAGNLGTITAVTTVTTVGTATDVTRIGNFGPNVTGLNVSASHFMHHAANAGSVHIYNQIAVT